MYNLPGWLRACGQGKFTAPIIWESGGGDGDQRTARSIARAEKYDAGRHRIANRLAPLLLEPSGERSHDPLDRDTRETRERAGNSSLPILLRWRRAT